MEPERREDVTDQCIRHTGCGGSAARPAGWLHLQGEKRTEYPMGLVAPACIVLHRMTNG